MANHTLLNSLPVFRVFSATATLTTLFGVDDTRDTLVRIGGVDGNPSPNGGVVTTVGPLGFNVTSSGGFDIQDGSGTAYEVMRLSGVATLFTINLTMGAATQIGAVGGGPFVDGIAVVPCAVPTPPPAATLSSTYADAVASRAIDGNTNGSYYANSVAVSDFQVQPFLQIDLGASRSLTNVTVYGRTDCCSAQ